MSHPADPQSEREILRKHVLYQRSFTPQPSSPRTITPIRYITDKPHKKPKKKKCPQVQKSTEKEATPARRKARTRMELLEFRRLLRVERERPWNDKPPEVKPPLGTLHLFYDRTLPDSIDKSAVTFKARKFVTNSKYGNIYEIRELPKKKEEKPPPPKRWVWEDEFLLWTTGSQRYMDDFGSTRRKPISLDSVTYKPSFTAPNRSSSMSSVRDFGRPNPNVFARYNYHQLERTRLRLAATLIQKVFRGWYIRAFIKKLKRKVLLEHGVSWKRFISDYRELMSRVRARYGMMKQSCSIDLKQIEQFLDRKYTYEKMFRMLASTGRLPRECLMAFFNRCDLWPTARELNRNFDTIYRGSRNTAEVVFVLDCSTITGTIGFHNLIKFVKDLVQSMDIGPDHTRVGVVPFNEDVFNSFPITSYSTKKDLIDAISKIKLWPGLTRTDLALRLMRDMFKDSRPGAQKLGIVITDGQSTYPENTTKEAKLSHDMGIDMFAIGVGVNVDMSELRRIASTPSNLFHVHDMKFLPVIRRHIERRFCLASCGFCRRLMPRIEQYGLLQHEAFDLIWTTFPPAAANVSSRRILHGLEIGTPTLEPFTASYVSRPIAQLEALEVIWTCYPPEACGLENIKVSRWIRPLVEGKEAWSMLDDDIIKATGIKACLQLVVQSRLKRHGYITVPSDVRDDVEKVTSETEALQIIEKFIKNRGKCT